MDEVPIKELARGHWSFLLPQLGVPATALHRKHGPCPICGGKDRYRWDDQNHTGGYICAACGAGDGFMLAQKCTGKDFATLAREVRALLRQAPPVSVASDQPRAPDRRVLARIWQGAHRPAPDGPVARYLAARLGRHWPSDAVREHPALHDPGTDRAWPALVARITDPAGEGASLHQTYLDPCGAKAPIETPRRLAAGTIPPGSAIRLWDARPLMGVAEGIETAFAAAIIYKMPVWSCISASMLAKFEPPAEVVELAIFADNDASFAGQAAAYKLAQRMVASGRKVTVFVPDRVGTDYADVLAQKS